MNNSYAKTVVILFLSIVVAYVFKAPVYETFKHYFSYQIFDDFKEQQIANAWNNILGKPSAHTPSFQWIAVGINSDVDIIVNGTKLLQKIELPLDETQKIIPTDHKILNTMSDLGEVFTYFHNKGAGGERFMDNESLFNTIASSAKGMNDAQLHIGGNAALIAQKLANIGRNKFKIMFGGHVGPSLKPLLHQSIKIPKICLQKQDEYHLILEYAKGSIWNKVSAPIASRFIFSNDVSNGQMKSFEVFMQGAKEFQPDLLILSGLHLLEGQSKLFWTKRLEIISTHLMEFPENIPVHLELASMTNNDYVETISTKIFPLVHSIGLNEQELMIICKSNGGPHCMDQEIIGPPPVAVTNDIIHWMLTKYSKPNSSRLTRIHFHTLTYHSIATINLSPWGNGDKAVAAGARIASVQACDDQEVQVHKADLFLSNNIELTLGLLSSYASKGVTFDPNNPVIKFSTDKVSMFITPVLVCKEPIKTVGLGDAISALGLYYSGYKSTGTSKI